MFPEVGSVNTKNTSSHSFHMETFGTSDWGVFNSCGVFGLVNVHLIKTLVPLFLSVFHVHSQNYLINDSLN